jgi:hypothetical protein
MISGSRGFAIASLSSYLLLVRCCVVHDLIACLVAASDLASFSSFASHLHVACRMLHAARPAESQTGEFQHEAEKF